MKHVVVVDDDIDVFDGIDVEWALATRVQADKDVLIISGARSKPLDPSLPPVPGRIPVTAKMGIDATIGPDVPRERYERIAYAYADAVKLDDFLGEGDGNQPTRALSEDAIKTLSGNIREVISEEPFYFAELAEKFSEDGFQAVGRALGLLPRRRYFMAGQGWENSVSRDRNSLRRRRKNPAGAKRRHDWRGNERSRSFPVRGRRLRCLASVRHHVVRSTL